MPPFINALPYAAPLEDTMPNSMNAVDTDESARKRGEAIACRIAADAIVKVTADPTMPCTAEHLIARAQYIDTVLATERAARIEKERALAVREAKEKEALNRANQELRDAERDTAIIETLRKAHVVWVALDHGDSPSPAQRARVYDAVRTDTLDRLDRGVQHPEWPEGLNANDIIRVARYVESLSQSTGVLSAAARVLKALQ